MFSIHDMAPETIWDLSLNNLSYRDILNFCQTNSFYNELICRDPTFSGSNPSGGLA